MQRVLSEAESAGRRVRTPRGASRLGEGGKRHRSRSSASIRAAREALMAVKGAVPPVPRTSGSGSRTPSGADRVLRKAGSRAAMGVGATPETSSNESAQPVSPARAPASPTQALKQSPSPSYVKQNSSTVHAKAPVSPTRPMQMPPTPSTPGRAGAEDSDDSYLSAVSETARGGLQSGDDSDSSGAKQILGRRAFGKDVQEVEIGTKASRGHARAGSTATARAGRVGGDLPSPTVSETTAVGSVHAA